MPKTHRPLLRKRAARLAAVLDMAGPKPGRAFCRDRKSSNPAPPRSPTSLASSLTAPDGGVRPRALIAPATAIAFGHAHFAYAAAGSGPRQSIRWPSA
jgi:hypothetical protein